MTGIQSMEGVLLLLVAFLLGFVVGFIVGIIVVMYTLPNPWS
jgi:hypothetical protein